MISDSEFELDHFEDDKGLFSWELDYSKKNIKDRGMLDIVKWEFRQYYNEMISKIRSDHFDP